ncbi:hypothetical protein JYU34_002823 [Plutella xylostella]|uniref:Uncharacterized protein n=2 Tax=Plutella xylostella TaxID=51655 RepID=A0ABQ7R3C2_PLUXY|nr:tigger transposable element-derived protein 6-like [Plutella xylostella]XP_011562564.1 tigger transposable element-derived protein 6 [Plutella xylostella]XP_037975084.2 tigger transposable element-derived protein 6-like [Plutella xylostella]XP_048481155.1 tigger transposable element-derived protein 6-like [Plutella xylostella]KAG7294875.1 hypothetical protein JYU34_022740 [Plutella xylostella]KAG7305123.1 hypothetical protein JYU34_010590 [Plutella xylostella]KAG7311763.1 hypothetical prot
MPKVRVRTTEKASWSPDSLNKAIRLIDGGSSIRNAAKVMGIPFSSLQKRIKKGSTLAPHLGRFTVFSREQEAELANLVKKMANIFYGCTANQIRRVAFEYAEKLNVKHNFNQASKMAGRDWLHAFMARNNISIRKPEATSINRITAFNKTEVSLFFELLGQLMEKHKFVQKNIYNCDETGISTVQTPGKILAAKGQKRVGSITSWERGKNITLLCAMSSAGGYIPPMFIFPRKRMTPLLEKDGPAGALYKCSDNGWINEHLFLEWLAHFKQHAKPSADEPILLILDNHASHISLSVYEYCKSNHIHMLSLPPHTSHRMQPLDVSFFGPLKMAYKKECDLFLKSHLAEKITPYDVASLVRKAFNNVASISKGESGFRSTGIFPLNPEVFTEEDFLAAETLQSETVVIEDCNESLAAACVIPSTSKEDSPVPSTSTQIVSLDLMMSNQEVPLDSESDVVPQVPGTSNQSSVLHDLIKMPEKASVIKTRQGRKKQHATILTSTPQKENLLEKEINKMKKKGGKEKEKTWKGKGQGKKTKVQKKGPEKAKRQVLQEQNETSVSDVGTDDLCQDDEDDDAEDAGNRCLVCDEFGRNNEMWYRCTSCGLWAHAECTGWESAEGYVCDVC